MAWFYSNKLQKVYTGDLQDGDRIATQQEIDDFLQTAEKGQKRIKILIELDQVYSLIKRAELDPGEKEPGLTWLEFRTARAKELLAELKAL